MAIQFGDPRQVVSELGPEGEARERWSPDVGQILTGIEIAVARASSCSRMALFVKVYQQQKHNHRHGGGHFQPRSLLPRPQKHER